MIYDLYCAITFLTLYSSPVSFFFFLFLSRMSLDISGSLNLFSSSFCHACLSIFQDHSISFLPPSVTHVSRYFRITQSLFFLLLSRMSLDISGSLNLFSSSFCHACLSIFQDHSISFLPPSVTHVSRYFKITQSLFFLLLSRMSLDISGSLNLFSSSFCHACLSIFQDHSISFLPLSVTHVSRYFRITQSLFFLFLSRMSLDISGSLNLFSSSFCHACLSIFQDHSISFLPLSVTHVSRYFRITQSLFFLFLSRMSLDISGSLNLFSSSFCHACLSIFQDHSISFLPFLGLSAFMRNKNHLFICIAPGWFSLSLWVYFSIFFNIFLFNYLYISVFMGYIETIDHNTLHKLIKSWTFLELEVILLKNSSSITFIKKSYFYL